MWQFRTLADPGREQLLRSCADTVPWTHDALEEELGQLLTRERFSVWLRAYDADWLPARPMRVWIALYVLQAHPAWHLGMTPLQGYVISDPPCDDRIVAILQSDCEPTAQWSRVPTWVQTMWEGNETYTCLDASDALDTSYS